MVAGREVIIPSVMQVAAGGVGTVVATEEHHSIQGLQELHTLLPLLLTQHFHLQTPSSLRPLRAMSW